MIHWMYFPKNRRLDKVSAQIVQAFEAAAGSIDSFRYQLKSNEVLEIVRPGLENCGFAVETSKKAEGRVLVPVLFGADGKIEKAFEADAYREDAGYVIEVEAGRAVTNYQFLKDFFEACTMNEVDYLCIAVRNLYQKSEDFSRVCTFFEALFASGRLGIPLKGILVVGY